MPPTDKLRVNNFSCKMNIMGVCSVGKSESVICNPWAVACRAPLSLGFLRVRILEWFGISFFRGTSQPRDRTGVSCIINLVGSLSLRHQGSPPKMNIIEKLKNIYIIYSFNKYMYVCMCIYIYIKSVYQAHCTWH